MSKQDRNGVRTAQDLERKYNFARLERAVKLYENVINREENIIDNFIYATVGSLLSYEGLKDGNITTYYYSGVPTMENVPANTWTVEDYENHVDDIYYDKATGYAYRFSLNEETGKYEWVREYVDYVIQALAIANSVTDTADGKRRVFADEPTPPYDNGDMWVKDGEVYICQISKLEDGVFDEDDFIIAPSYTDDTLAIKVNNALKVMQGIVSIIRAGQSEIEAKVEDVDKNLISRINMSTEAIKLYGKRFVVVSDNLTIAEDGTITAKAGKIADFDIGEDGLTYGSIESGVYTKIAGDSIRWIAGIEEQLINEIADRIESRFENRVFQFYQAFKEAESESFELTPVGGLDANGMYKGESYADWVNSPADYIVTWDGKGKFSEFVQPVLPDGTDFDDITSPNTYTIKNSSSAGYNNCPLQSGTGTLVVEACGDEGQVHQIVKVCNKVNPAVHERFYYQGSWGNWLTNG